MPRKKIDPEELKRQNVKAKLISIALIISLVMVTNVAMSQRASSEEDIQAAKQGVIDAKGAVLGEVDETEEKFAVEARKQAQLVADQVYDQTTTVLEESKERIDSTVSDLVYNSTIKPLIERIEALPDDQQKAVRDAVCKPE